MKLHRFIGNFDFSRNQVEITNPENIKQIKGVLRLGEGDFLILCDGAGNEFEVKILEISKNAIICEIEKKLDSKEIGNKVSLYLAILKKENFELAVQKAVECGVSEIIPMITERTVKTGLNAERLEKIIKEASEQCGRTFVPKLYEIMKFENAIEDGLKNQTRIFYDTDTNQSCQSCQRSCQSPALAISAKSVSIFIGPEGGFVEKENKIAKDSGYTVASLGSLTLRAETAAIVATHRAVYNI